MLYFGIGCFHQPGLCVSEDNLFLKRTVHKLRPLSDSLFVYAEVVPTAISVLPSRECSRGFGNFTTAVNSIQSSSCIF